MIDGNRQIRRFSYGFLCIAAGVAVGAAGWVNPAPPGAAVPPPGAASPPAAAAVPPPSAVPPASSVPAAASGLAVAAWRIVSAPQPGAGPPLAMPGRPVYLSMTLTGGEAAVERLRRQGHLAIEVHWTNRSGGGAPDLVTDLTIGNPGLAPRLEYEVRRKGYFEWHSWARKDTLSPGAWTVSVTRPDGQPLPCGGSGGPCRFSFSVG